MKNHAELLGLRVVLVCDIDRYPHFMARKGLVGTVTCADERTIAVKMDELIDGAEEWNNEICWDYMGDGVEQGIPEFFVDCKPVVL